MSRDPLVQRASEVLNAIQALRLKRHHLRRTHEGVVIEQTGKPDLLLTYEAAHRFAQERAEAESE